MPESDQSQYVSPVGDPESLDVLGERKDGGVDMLVVVTRYLDESDETCTLLEQKLDNYIRAAVHPNFPLNYPEALRGRVRIFVDARHGISDRARTIVERLSREALSRGISVQIGNPVA